MTDDLSRLVDGILERIVDAELITPDLFRGCSESSLDALARYFGFPLPAAYRRVLERCGRCDGYTFLSPPGSILGSTFWDMFSLHDMVQNPVIVGGATRVVPDHWFVFRCLHHRTYRFHCLDTDLGDNPPVFEVALSRDHTSVDRTEQPVQIADRFTEYLSQWVDEGIRQRSSQLAFHSAIESANPETEIRGPHARIFELLAKIRRAPEMWIPGLQLSVLETYLHGFEHGSVPTGHSDSGTMLFSEFSDFIYKRHRLSTCSGWAFAIREAASHDKMAWEFFFELIDEFRVSLNS